MVGNVNCQLLLKGPKKAQRRPINHTAFLRALPPLTDSGNGLGVRKGDEDSEENSRSPAIVVHHGQHHHQSLKGHHHQHLGLSNHHSSSAVGAAVGLVGLTHTGHSVLQPFGVPAASDDIDGQR